MSMTDVFDEIVGQDRAVHALRNLVQTPSHAYLLSGPPGSAKRETALAAAAALQCENGGCGTCDECQRVLRGTHPDVTVVSRAGVNWSVDEIRDAERVARRIPVQGRYQILVLPNIELSVLAAPALLKTLEEPPRRTIFILLADELPDHLITIESRCVKVAFAALSFDDIVTVLERSGVPSMQARMAAEAADGDLDRARVVARDEELAQRVTVWRTIPDQLRSESPVALAQSIMSGLDAAIAPLQAVHAEELDTWKRAAELAGRRGGQKDVEQRHQREQRRFRTDELRFGLATLTRSYRERLVASLEGGDEGDVRATSEARSSIAAITAIAHAYENLTLNANENLLLTDLLTTLTRT